MESADPERGCSRPKMGVQQEAELAAMLRQGAEKHCFQGGFCTYKLIASVIERRFGIRYRERAGAPGNAACLQPGTKRG